MTQRESHRQDRLDRLVRDSKMATALAHDVARQAVLSEVRFVEELVDRRGRDTGHEPDRRRNRP